MLKDKKYLQLRYKALLKTVRKEKELFLASVENKIYDIIGVEALEYTEVEVSMSDKSKTILDNDLMLYVDIYSDEFQVRVNYDIPFDKNSDKELHAMVQEYFNELNR